MCIRDSYIAALDLKTRQFRVLTSGGLDESPSFAPNGRMIIYSNGRQLNAVSVDGLSLIHILVVSDADGQNPNVILRSSQPIMSPSWSPDGSRLAYVSFEGRRPQIVVQEVYSGARRVVSAAPGINGAPSWAPNGQRLAFTLSKDGNPEIYALDLGGQNPVRLTNGNAIDTEPVWLPDGSIVFTSDRGGSPQLYRIGPGGGAAQRLTFEGDYNASPTVSPDGRYIAMVHRRGGRFYIAALDLDVYKRQPMRWIGWPTATKPSWRSSPISSSASPTICAKTTPTPPAPRLSRAEPWPAVARTAA